MKKIILSILLAASPVFAGGRGGHHSHSAASDTTIARDANGRIARSSSERQAFLNQTGYPHGRPGYVVDHVVPLYKGGADAPRNMQWQTKSEAKAKDKWE